MIGGYLSSMQSLTPILRAFSPTTTTPQQLSLWHAAIAPIPRSDILPIGMGNVDNRANIAAFFGDQKILSHVGLELRQRGFASRGVGWLTTVTGQAVSNELFARQFQTILPVQSVGLEQKSSIRDCGTMVEAAVDAVEDDRAVSELAAWLLDHSLELGNQNAKGRLLQLGGKVTSTKEPKSMDHSPVFRAVATWNNQRAEAHGRTKVEAEQAAATKLDLGDVSSELELGSVSDSGSGNSKGRLLQRGGTVRCSKDPTTPDHRPSFIATANIGTDSVKMAGSTKAKAEQLAAKAILAKFST